MKRVLGGVAMVLALSATAAWAVHTFSDVPDDHPQADDIAYAVEQGWFQGYPDGTFKPDRALATHQAVTVFGRAFPDGVSRADLATILRAGETALTTTTTSAPPEEVCGGELCVEDNYYFERFGNDYWAFRFRVDKSCSGFYVEVHLLDDNDRRTGDWGNDFVGSVTEGSQVTVEIRYTKDWSQYEFEWSC